MTEEHNLYNHNEPPESAHEGTICLVKGNLCVYVKGKWEVLKKDNTVIITKEQAESILFLIDISESCIEATEFGGDYGNLSEEYDKLEYDLEKKIK